MNCNGFDSELRSSIERSETIDRLDLREHAVGCPRCRAVWEQSVLLDRAIAAWKGQVPAVDLADRIMARWAFDSGIDRGIDSEIESGGRLVPGLAERNCPAGRNGGRPAAASKTTSSRSAARRLDRRIVVAAAVAVLAIVLIPLLWRAADPPGTPSGNLAHESSPRAAASPAGASRPVRLDSAVRDAGSAWLGLASEATGTVREMAVFLPERTLAVAIETPAEGALTRPTQWTERLREEIHPIRRDVGKAMDFLLEAVPLSRGRTL